MTDIRPIGKSLAANGTIIAAINHHTKTITLLNNNLTPQIQKLYPTYKINEAQSPETKRHEPINHQNGDTTNATLLTNAKRASPPTGDEARAVYD